MKIWGIYSDAHPELDLGGERQGLRELAERIISAHVGDVVLDAPPADWEDGTHALHTIRLAPSDDPADRIEFRREGTVLVVAGGSAELARIVGGSINNLADSPYRVTEGSVPTHLHLDPTSDPERRTYSAESLSLTVHLADED
jgi:hypothetical protein